MFTLRPGLRVQTTRDIDGALGAVIIRGGTAGTVVDVRSWRTVMVQFDTGRCIAISRRALERI